ncbi:MAG: hypothetical protein JO163_09195 [Methylobacteriaceae bacterium]|nr:hypothetical protein [Methylobacteriaceae bacterium]
MSYRAIYAYAWDLAERGVAAVVDEVRALGLDTISLASSYHAGKFLRPKGSAGKVYFPDDGTVYFKARPELYATIKPIQNGLVAERDVLREICATSGIAANAWLVLMHNTRLGQAHPQSTVRNAFGDRYIYSLCPTAPEARQYATALCRDITESYPVAGISLETPGFLPYVHGFHHEFALVRQNRWLDNHLGLCFCDHCLDGAAAAGIDARRLRARVAQDIEAYLASDLDFPDDMAEAFWLSDSRTDGDLSAYLRWRCDVVTSLVREIRGAVRADASVAVIPSVARPSAGAWYEGSDLRGLAEAAGIIEACFYEPSAERVRADAWDVRRRLGGVGHLRGILRPAHPDLKSRAEVVAAVAGLRALGITEIAFYNYGHVRRSSLEWIGAALAGAGN